VVTPSASMAESPDPARGLVGVASGGGNEETGLAKVLREREATRDRQVADDAVRHDALYRDVVGVGLVRREGSSARYPSRTISGRAGPRAQKL
jgi:hypothetical protein